MQRRSSFVRGMARGAAGLAVLAVPIGVGQALPRPSSASADLGPAAAPLGAADFAARQGVTELMRSARYWLAHGRADIARTVLDKVLHVRADHAQALLLLGELELRSGRLAPARLALDRLAAQHPRAAETRELRQLFVVYGDQRGALEQLRQARQLRQLGRPIDLRAMALRLFPDGRPPGTLAAEFAALLGNPADGWDHGSRADLAPRVGSAALTLRTAAPASSTAPNNAAALHEPDPRSSSSADAVAAIAGSATAGTSADHTADHTVERTDQRTVGPTVPTADVTAAMAAASVSATGLADATPPAPAIDTSALRDLADARLAAGRVDDARDLLAATLAQQPQAVWVRHDLARLLLRQGQPAAARELMHQGFVQESSADGADTTDLRRAAALVALASDEPDDAVVLLSPAPGDAESVDAEMLARARFEAAALRLRRELVQFQFRDEASNARLDSTGAPVDAAGPLSSAAADAAHRADEDRLADALQQATASAADDPLRLASLARLRDAQARLVQQQSRVEAGISVGHRHASAGLGELASRETTLRLSADSAGFGPLGPSLREHLPAGRWWAQLDHTALDAGSLPAAWAQASEFGRVRQLGGPAGLPIDLAAPLVQRAEGLAAGLGWAAGNSQADLGVVGLGMPVSRWVGGWRWDDWQASGRHLGVELSRRAETGSLLAWAGAVDPVSGQAWGGVTRTAVTLRAGLPLGVPTAPGEGGAQAGAAQDTTHEGTRERSIDASIDSSLRIGRLDGRNVASTSLVQWRGGLDLGLMSRADLRLSTGLTLDLWHYGRNLGQYSWGQAGTYSPQRYAALGLPLLLDARGPGWTLALRAAISRSWTHEDAAPWFPTDDAAQAGAGDPRYRGGAGGGLGASLRAAAEWQIAPQWRLGASVSAEHSSDYAPRRAGLWLRHGLGREPAAADFPLRTLDSYTRY